MPAIRPNYLGDAEGYDLKMLIEGARISREIFAQAPFAAYRGEEIFPGRSAAKRCRSRNVRAPQGRDDLSPGRHLPHGPR